MEKKFSMAKSIIKTSVITILSFVMAFFFVAIGFYVINPKLSAKICSTLGWTSLEVSCYELSYARGKDTNDLYNIVVKLGSSKQYEKRLDYVNKLLNVADYSEFCEKLDNSIKLKYENNQINAKVYSNLYGTNEYVRSQNIILLLKLNRLEKAKEIALASLETDKQYEVAIYYYLDYLMSDAVSTEVCKNYFAQIHDEVITKLNDKNIGLSSILTNYEELKIKYSIYVLEKMTSDNQSTINLAYNEYTSALDKYNQSIGE